jgi:8-oxo-dGTP pyrophosphatase MutT (NUDIX family)
MIIDYDDLEERLRTRLVPPADLAKFVDEFDDADALARQGRAPGSAKPAAVLMLIVRRPEGWTMMLTERAQHVPTHAGDIVFPGGHPNGDDEGPIDTALREAEEETGVPRRLMRPVGGYEPFVTQEGYRITPVVGCIDPGFEARPDPREVAAVFEVPLAFLLDPANHLRLEQQINGQRFVTDTIQHDGWNIWGVPAIFIRLLYERLYGAA